VTRVQLHPSRIIDIMSLSLRNRVAIVTGASRGIGYGIALELAKRGAKVVITYTSAMSAEPVNDLIAQIRSLNNGADAIGCRSDLSTLEAPKIIVDATIAYFGQHIDILVNNAGIEKVVPFKELTTEDFSQVFDLNVRGVFFLSQAVLPHLRKPGRIINISSVGARHGFAQLSTYCASKAAMEGFTRSLAKEIGSDGHTVNAVEPGPVETEMIHKIPKDIVDMQKRETPMENRLATVEEIALIVAWLAEDQSRWVTGQTISASGGWSMM
jgi:3-oxoacyl-[acyl-carrier protein] reductase